MKMPGLDDLKKMGSGLVDTSKIGGVVTKIKSGMEDVVAGFGKKTSAEDSVAQDPLSMASQLSTKITALAEENKQQALQIEALSAEINSLRQACEKQANMAASAVETGPQEPPESSK